MNDTIIECVRSAGGVLLDYFGKSVQASIKENQSNVVTQADLASEKCIIDIIQAKFPMHNIIAEETGFQDNGSDITWIIDPLDGTSNFSAGIPWFGVMVAILQNAKPIMAAMYLPVSDILYYSEIGKGVLRNNTPVHVTDETDLSKVLCSYGLDSSEDEQKTRKEIEFLSLLVDRARNVRATNSLVDFCYTIDGRLGGCINQSTKIWDIAPATLMLPEAGGVLTNIGGDEITFSLNAESCSRTYPVVGASSILHPQIIEIAKHVGIRNS